MSARWNAARHHHSGGSDMVNVNPGPKLHRKVTLGVARGAQLMCAEQTLCRLPGRGPLRRRRLRPLVELLSMLGIYGDTRGVKARRGPHALDEEEDDGVG